MPLSPAIVSLLKAQRTAQAAERLHAGKQWTDSGLVFTTSSAARWTRATFRGPSRSLPTRPASRTSACTFIQAKQSGAERLIGFFATRIRFGLWFRNVAMRTMNFGPLATLFAGSVRDDFELPEYGM